MVIFFTEFVIFLKTSELEWLPLVEISKIFFLPYVIIDLLKQNVCQDSNLRVKPMYESVK